MSAIDDLRAAVADGRGRDAVAAAERGLADDVPAAELLDGLMAAMRDVGKLFEEGEIFVPEMLVSAHAMKDALEILRPGLVGTGVQSSGRVAIGTVKGDVHDIGKNLVAMMLEGSGFEVEDLGTDVYPERFVEAARNADVLLLSALLTTTMTNMSEVIDAIVAAGLRDRVRILVGGAPITDEYAAAIGADGYAKDAPGAVRLVENVIAAATAA
jgi:5-methyltetrahydrofolate--homocysteine methyltransferase